MAIKVLDLFAGPGWARGATDAGLDLDVVRISAPTAEGGDSPLDAETLGRIDGARGLVSTPPLAVDPGGEVRDADALHDAITAIGWWEAAADGTPERWSGSTWGEIREDLGAADHRTVLFAAVCWAVLRLRGLDWVILDQAPEAAGPLRDVADELMSLDWASAEVFTAGSGGRVFLAAHRVRAVYPAGDYSGTGPEVAGALLREVV